MQTQLKTPPIAFTKDNFCAVARASEPQAVDIKTETRRLASFDDNGIMKAAKYKVGDCCYLTEPTQIIRFDEFSSAPSEVIVQYFWHEKLALGIKINCDDEAKITNRKTGVNSKQIARFMLKSFARYWVEITEVRCERLLDITVEAAIAEGIKYQDYRDDVGFYRSWFDYTQNSFRFKDPILSYISEIEMLHGKAIVQSNPWLWVYKFKLYEIAKS